MKILEMLVPQQDKVNSAEMGLLGNKLPERVTKPIPSCLYFDKLDPNDEEEINRVDFEVLNLLVWIMARRENPDMTVEQVGERIGLNHPDYINDLIKEVTYFYTRLSREDIEERFADESKVNADPIPGEESIPSETN